MAVTITPLKIKGIEPFTQFIALSSFPKQLSRVFIFFIIENEHILFLYLYNNIKIKKIK